MSDQHTPEDEIDRKDNKTDEEIKKEERKKYIKKETLEWIKSIGAAVIIALLLRTFVFEFVLVDGISMVPTLQNRELMIMEKISYRFHEPEYGDIVICKYPQELDDIVKRVIGKPGDTIAVVDGILYRNDVRVDEPYIAEPMLWDFGPETVPEGHYFVMGDNRNVSKDSRRVGPLDEDVIIGRVAVVLWPLNMIKLI